MTSRIARSLDNFHLSPTLVVFAFCLAFVGATLYQHDGDPMAFARIGTRFDSELGATVSGYDGQFAYQIAKQALSAAAHLDAPAYRYQRILYPLLARVLSLGLAELLPWVLIAINAGSITAGTGLTGRILARQGLSPWFALAFALNIGMLMALRLDLNEPLAFLFVQWGFLSWLREEKSKSAISFALAAVTKEVTLILAAGLGLSLLLRGSKWRAVRWGAVVVSPYLAWILLLRAVLGEWAPRSGGALATAFQWVPYRGWWDLAGHVPQQFLLVSVLIVPLAIAPSIAGLVLAGRKVVAARWNGPTLALGMQSLAYLFLPTSVLVDPLGISRFGIGLIAAFIAFGASTKKKRVLAYVQLALLSTLFLWGDSFLPGG